MNQQKPRLAFSLIELLIIVALVGLLMALLLPSIQRIRETANKLVCASNLRQIALASHTYHSDHGRLPPGELGSASGKPLPLIQNVPYTGVLVHLLPYLEADNIHEQINPNSLGLTVPTSLTSNNWWSDPRNAPDGSGLPYNLYLSNTRIKQFLCPADDVSDIEPLNGVILAMTEYPDQAVAYPTPTIQNIAIAYYKVPPLNVMPRGRTNYLGVSGANGEIAGFSISEVDPVKGPIDLRKYTGIYVSRNTISLGQIAVQDGTSNTMMFGEGLGGEGTGPYAHDYMYSWMGCGRLGTRQGLGRGNVACMGNVGSSTTGAFYSRFSSRHSGGVQFAFADGAVKTLRFGSTCQRNPASLDWYLLQQLSGKNDGLQQDLSSLLD